MEEMNCEIMLIIFLLIKYNFVDNSKKHVYSNLKLSILLDIICGNYEYY